MIFSHDACGQAAFEMLKTSRPVCSKKKILCLYFDKFLWAYFVANNNKTFEVLSFPHFQYSTSKKKKNGVVNIEMKDIQKWNESKNDSVYHAVVRQWQMRLLAAKWSQKL